MQCTQSIDPAELGGALIHAGLEENLARNMLKTPYAQETVALLHKYFLGVPKPLKRLFLEKKIVIPECNGMETIAELKDICYYIDEKFSSINLPGKPTPPTDVAIYELEENVMLHVATEYLTAEPQELYFEQSQIHHFLREHQSYLVGHPGSNLFLFCNEQECYVISVRIDINNELCINLYHHNAYITSLLISDKFRLFFPDPDAEK